MYPMFAVGEGEAACGCFSLEGDAGVRFELPGVFITMVELAVYSQCSSLLLLMSVSA